MRKRLASIFISYCLTLGLSGCSSNKERSIASASIELRCKQIQLSNPFNSSGIIRENTYLQCNDNDESYYAKIKGIALSMGAATKNYTLRCSGNDPVGDYIGVEIGVCLAVGGHCGIMMGEEKSCLLSGHQAGLKLSIGPSFIKTTIVRKSEKNLRQLQEE